MSAFFVADATVDAVVTLLRRLGVDSIPDSHPDLGHRHHSTQTDLDQCGRQLLLMNADALFARYPSIRDTQEARDMLAAAHAYRFTARNEGNPTLTKQLACFTYQCCEGDIPNRPLYRTLEAVEQAATPPDPTGLRASAAYLGPAWAARREYDAAPWGIEA